MINKEKLIHPEWHKGNRLTYRPQIHEILRQHGVNLPLAFTNRQALDKAKMYHAMGAFHLSKLIKELVARLTHASWNAIDWEYAPYRKTFSPKERAKEKQKARDEDEQAMISGKLTPEEVQKKNGLFFFPDAVIDFKSARKP